MSDADEDAQLSPAAFHILIALADGDQHGYAVMKDVAERTSGRIRLGPGTLYGTIKRLLEQGFVEEVRRRASSEPHDERRRTYHLTRSGRRAAQAEVARMAETLKQARSLGLAP